MMNYFLSLPAPVSELLARLKQAGFSAYAVGGCVRDSLLGLEPHDWDICTSALPGQMKEAFSGYHTVETGLKHGTLTVVIEHVPYEVTTFRVDGDYTDHRHPDSVIFVDDLTKDLARRDFTVNAMAWSPENGLQDPFGGRQDLSAKIIRCWTCAMWKAAAPAWASSRRNSSICTRSTTPASGHRTWRR